MPPSEDFLAVVLRTRDLTQLAVVRSLLEAHGISVVTEGEETIGLFAFGWIPGLFGSRKAQAMVKVHADDAQVARDLVEGALLEEGLEASAGPADD